MKNKPIPPEPPLCRVITVTVLHTCPICHSSMPRSGFLRLWGKRRCLNKKCKNYKTGKMKREEKPSEGFLNGSNLVFNNISSESEREYGFPNGQTLYIGKPLYLNVSKSGGHRLYTEDGWCYYVQPKECWWIRWKVREGQPHFVK